MNLNKIKNVWKVKLPFEEMDIINKISSHLIIRRKNKTIPLPWPPLSDEEICSAKAVAKDWDLKDCYLPIMGDFHNLVCVDFTNRTKIEIVVLDDERNEQIRFNTIKDFLYSLETAEPKNPDISGKVKVWLDPSLM
jgi:hypothetical protein